MSKRLWSLALAGALVASVLNLGTAGAQEAPEIPAEPNIVDPSGDANYHSTLTGVGGGLSATGADILAIWFTHDADNVYMHVQTTSGARIDSLTFITSVDPGVGATCLQLRLSTGGELNDPFTSISRSGDCGEGTEVVGEVTEEVGPEDTAILTGAYPRSAGEELADGKVLASPSALVGHNAQQVSPRVLIIDDTEVGTDYSIGGGDPEPEPEPGPGPVEPKDPPKKKNCAKIKNKKKRKKCKKQNKKKGKKPPVEKCAPYTPGELGAEAETIVLTDAATAEEPVVHEVELDMYFFEGLPGTTPPSQTLNVQVDSDAATTGLYATFAFPSRRDYDLWAYWPSGSEAASSHGFNPLVEAKTPPPLPDLSNTSSNHAGETTAESENLVGVITPDCGGYTLEMTNFFGEGGTLELSLWLGEGTTEPKPEES